jgi:hypothetical protein
VNDSIEQNVLALAFSAGNILVIIPVMKETDTLRQMLLQKLSYRQQIPSIFSKSSFIIPTKLQLPGFFLLVPQHKNA